MDLFLASHSLCKMAASSSSRTLPLAVAFGHVIHVRPPPPPIIIFLLNTALHVNFQGID